MAPNNVETGRERWQDVSSDPDLDDLGYDIADWKVVRARKDDQGHLMFLPENEEQLHDEAFIVAETNSVCDVVDRI